MELSMFIRRLVAPLHGTKAAVFGGFGDEKEESKKFHIGEAGADAKAKGQKTTTNTTTKTIQWSTHVHK